MKRAKQCSKVEIEGTRNQCVYMRTHRLRGDAEADCARVQNDLNRLANGYYIKWSWQPLSVVRRTLVCRWLQRVPFDFAGTVSVRNDKLKFVGQLVPEE
jgi:hypothetical protein